MQYPIIIPSVEDFTFSMPIQLRFNDIDILGHLNNTVYFSLYDTGKARWMEAVNHGAVNWQRVESIIANVNCAYLQQIHFGDELTLHTRCIHIGNKSFTLQQMLTDANGIAKSICETVMVHYNPDTAKPEQIGDDWRNAILSYERVKPETLTSES